jgi:hypothetical protein
MGADLAAHSAERLREVQDKLITIINLTAGKLPLPQIHTI